MRLSDYDRSPGGRAVKVICIQCRKPTYLCDVRADLDGEAFIDYYCCFCLDEPEEVTLTKAPVSP